MARKLSSQVLLRLPPELKAQLDEAARTSNRSLNSEILTRLEASLGVEIASPGTPRGRPVQRDEMVQVVELTAEKSVEALWRKIAKELMADPAMKEALSSSPRKKP